MALVRAFNSLPAMVRGMVMMLVMIQLGDPASPGVWFATVVAGLLSAIPFAIIAVQVRLWAELVSILFDIFRLLTEMRRDFQQ